MDVYVSAAVHTRKVSSRSSMASTSLSRAALEVSSRSSNGSSGAYTSSLVSSSRHTPGAVTADVSLCSDVCGHLNCGCVNTQLACAWGITYLDITRAIFLVVVIEVFCVSIQTDPDQMLKASLHVFSGFKGYSNPSFSFEKELHVCHSCSAKRQRRTSFVPGFTLTRYPSATC